MKVAAPVPLLTAVSDGLIVSLAPRLDASVTLAPETLFPCESFSVTVIVEVPPTVSEVGDATIVEVVVEALSALNVTDAVLLSVPAAIVAE